MNGIAICWPNKRRIPQLAASGRIPSLWYPRKVDIKGTPLVLVTPDGQVLLACELSGIEGPKPILDATGTRRDRGYVLIASKRTVRRPRAEIMNFKWRAEGQMRYFDAKKHTPVVFNPQVGGEFLDVIRLEPDNSRVLIKPFGRGAPGKPSDHPESVLIRQYVDWIGSEDRFVHTMSLSSGLYADLFNRTVWTLIEAKATLRDESIREAFGQLHDYKRDFRRKPSLAILIPERPMRRTMQFLRYFKVAAVWPSSRGFSDSVHGRLTTDLRRRYRALAR